MKTFTLVLSFFLAISVKADDHDPISKEAAHLDEIALDKAYLDADARLKVGEIVKWMRAKPRAKAKVDAFRSVGNGRS